MKACPKGATRITVSYQNVSGPYTTFAGQVFLQKRLDYCVGLRVLHADIRLASGSTATILGGYLYTVNSSRLGSIIARNPFQFALSADATASTAVAFTSVIGLSSSGSGSFTENYATKDGHLANTQLDFHSPTPIEQFDWELVPVQGTWSISGPYTIELVLEFYPICSCCKKPGFELDL